MAKSDCGKAPLSYPETAHGRAEWERIFPTAKRVVCPDCDIRLSKGSTQCSECGREVLA